jgi:LysM repeat protein
MSKSKTALARVVAFTALVAAVLVVIVVVSSSLDEGGSSAKHRSSHHAGHRKRTVHVPATYTIRYGDTLTSIAHRVGISVVRIESLNPGVDPQALIAGRTLKLR